MTMSSRVSDAMRLLQRCLGLRRKRLRGRWPLGGEISGLQCPIRIPVLDPRGVPDSHSSVQMRQMCELFGFDRAKLFQFRANYRQIWDFSGLRDRNSVLL
jgi:hypothetical protein